jgi:diguanylate cyclase (GGDEF)-like protein
MFDWNSTIVLGMQETAALAAVALIGYLFGRRTRQSDRRHPEVQRHAELERATRIARQLETIAVTLRQELASHHAQVARFKKRLNAVQEEESDASWEALCGEAESILAPTLELASQLSQAYDKIRKQSNALLAFTEGRIDPVTGVGNGRSLEEQLAVLLSAMSRGGAGLSVALVGIDPVECLDGESQVDHDIRVLQEVAATIQLTMRDNDFVARYGADEFVVVMPHTTLAGGSVFGDRLRRKAESELATTVCCGITVAAEGDTIKALLARADSAFYSAKAAGANRQFLHTGSQIRQHHGAGRERMAEQPAAEDEATCDEPVCH